jgi:glycine/D-amino acid oxidase-like deaminating enzyme
LEAHTGADKTVVLTPHIFLPWLRQRLEKSGVKFVRKSLQSLADLKGSGYDVLINATSLGARYLADVADKHMVQVRGQTVLAKTSYNKVFMRHGKDYTYVIPRLDGTAILGGIKQHGET